MDKRRFKRYVVKKRAKITDAANRWFSCDVVDISIAGIGLMSPYNLKKNSKIKIETKILLGEENYTVEFDANVAFCSLAGMDGFRVGCQFVSMGPRSNDILERYIKEREKRDQSDSV